MTDYYVRAYHPPTETEDWIGPLPQHMAGLVAEGLDGQRQTRVYHEDELPGILDLRNVIRRALDKASSDFRTPASLAKELKVDETIIRKTLLRMDDVRRPVVPDSKYDDWFRLKSRGLSREEKRARWFATMTFSRMRDDY